MNPIVFVRQVGPPLLLLPLFAASFDVTWLFGWIAGGMAVLISVVTLVGVLRKGAGGEVSKWTIMTRPLLTILLVSSAYGYALLVQADADSYGKQLVAVVQRSCQEQEGCLASLEGWHVNGKYAHTKRGPWTFTYFTDPSRHEFALVVHENWETERCIYGGSSIDLIEVVSVDCLHDPNLPKQLESLIGQ